MDEALRERFEFVKQTIQEIDQMAGTTPMEAHWRYVIGSIYRSEGMGQADIDRLEANGEGLFNHLSPRTSS